MESNRLRIGLLRETATDEHRVALVPGDVARMRDVAEVVVETGAGELAGFGDASYRDAGALVEPRNAVLASADVVVAVRAPMIDDFRSGSALVSLGAYDETLVSGTRLRGIRHLALERVPRTAAAQRMDVLSSQSSLAGYAAVLEGACRINAVVPMMTTAAGTLKPLRMMAVGAGVAGLQALATARRLGAQTFGFDIRPAAREQVQSLGARFVPVESIGDTETGGGYAAQSSEDDLHAARRTLARNLGGIRLVVTSAQVPGRAAPILFDDGVIAALPKGAVIVDLAAGNGGNTVYTRPGEAVDIDGVVVFAPANPVGMVATDASRLFSGNIRALLQHLSDTDALRPGVSDPIVDALLGRVLSATAARDAA
jgi:NAD(P) transhydrogenase subunit alpha